MSTLEGNDKYHLMWSAADPLMHQAPNLITQTHSVYSLPAASPSVAMATGEQAESRGMGSEGRGVRGNVGKGGKEGRGAGEGRRLGTREGRFSSQ